MSSTNTPDANLVAQAPVTSVPLTGGGIGLKEPVAGLLSLAIMGFTLWMMWKMFTSEATIPDPQWQRMSSILQVAVGFAGTVTGYYFGRIPAERAAATAQQAANTANRSLAETTAVARTSADNEARMRARIQELRKQLITPVGGGTGPGSPDAVRLQIAQQLDQIM